MKSYKVKGLQFLILAATNELRYWFQIFFFLFFDDHIIVTPSCMYYMCVDINQMWWSWSNLCWWWLVAIGVHGSTFFIVIIHFSVKIKGTPKLWNLPIIKKMGQSDPFRYDLACNALPSYFRLPQIGNYTVNLAYFTLASQFSFQHSKNALYFTYSSIKYDYFLFPSFAFSYLRTINSYKERE